MLLWRGRSDTKETWDVPAFHTLINEGSNDDDTNRTKVQKASLEGLDVMNILDPTGCGNTFCGGFLAGWYKTRNLLTAALWGSVSASFSKPFSSYLHVLRNLSCSSASNHFQVSAVCFWFYLNWCWLRFPFLYAKGSKMLGLSWGEETILASNRKVIYCI